MLIKLGTYGNIRDDGLDQLEAHLFTPNGGRGNLLEDKLITFYKASDVDITNAEILDGNHRVVLFQKHGVQHWECRVIDEDFFPALWTR